MTAKADVLQGTLDLLVLKTVATEPMHGYGIAQRINLSSRDLVMDETAHLVRELIRTMGVQPHNILFPAIFLSLTVLAVNLVGDGLRDLLDPRLARRM